MITSAGEHYYYTQGGLKDIYILNSDGEIISHIVINITGIVGIYDVFITSSGSIALCVTKTLGYGTDADDLYIARGKQKIDFTLDEQIITELYVSQPGVLGRASYKSILVDDDNDYVYTIMIDGYSSSNYTYTNMSVDYLSSANNFRTIQIDKRDEGTMICMLFICKLDANRVLALNIGKYNTGVCIYTVSTRTFAYYNSIDVTETTYITYDDAYIYALRETGVNKISKGDLSEETISSSTIAKYGVNRPFQILESNVSQFVDTNLNIYSTAYASAPLITLDDYYAYIKCKE